MPRGKPRKVKLEESSKIDVKSILEDQAEKIIPEDLPHLNGLPWYKWAWEFFNDYSRNAFLCSANQIGKSSVLIRKVIDLATNKEKQLKIWGRIPTQFWYLYPTKGMATVEFNEKWVKEFLPRNEMKTHPIYGWKETFQYQQIHTIKFNSGVTVYFKSYEQSESSLQASSVFFIACFVKGTLITTPDGLVDIDLLVPGDLVLCHDGSFQKISKIFRQNKSVITRKFSNGEIITATADHPFYVNGFGFKSFSLLTESDILTNQPLWKPIKKLYYLKEFFTLGVRNIKTQEKKTISGFLENFCMLLCGNRFIKDKFLKITSFIIKILILLSTRLIICNYYLELNILKFIKEKSGNGKNPIRIFVLYVKMNFSLEVLREKPLCFVLRLAGAIPLGIVLFVKLLLKLARITRDRHVVESAKTFQDLNQEVINLEVESTHTYFSQGFLVHNCDEEMPVKFWEELSMRRDAVDGLFNLVMIVCTIWMAPRHVGPSKKLINALPSVLQKKKFNVASTDASCWKNAKFFLPSMKNLTYRKKKLKN
jgi:hypothetical protein